MKNLRQQFIIFRSTTPKRVQWLPLVAAFVVVIILIVLLFSHKSSNNDKIGTASEIVSFVVEPNRVDLSGVKVGDSKSQDLNIKVNTPVVLDGITVDADNITTMNNCDNLTDSCIVNVTYKPIKSQSETETTLKITWHILSQADIIKTYDVPVVYSAIEDIKPVVIEPEPIVEPVVVEPVPEAPVTYIGFDDEDEEDDDYYEQSVPMIDDMDSMREEITDEINSVSAPDIFSELKIEPEFTLPPEKCSDFAIPGYDQSGVQIGWIKPERGANYFHPFSDTDCSNPTGRYDFSTGIITSLRNGSKIGTDANHIGYRNVYSMNFTMPDLSLPKSMDQKDGTFGDNAKWTKDLGLSGETKMGMGSKIKNNWYAPIKPERYLGSADKTERVVSSQPYDRTFILRQFKPIPATIVSEVRADPSVYGCSGVAKGDCVPGKNYSIPVRATVDRNVYSDDGRTIIIPTGTLLMGYLIGELPGPYQAVGRMNIKWYQFIRPDGVEFNFKGESQHPYSADAQGRVGVPGHGSTDYIEQMVMPILTSLVPAAVNMIAPIADTVINQIDLDNNTIVQSGTVRSSEMAKQEVINTWNKVAQKLLVDVMANTVPPFSIAAGTRINVYSPVDLIVTCGTSENNPGKKCAIEAYNKDPRDKWSDLKKEVKIDTSDASWVGQVRAFDLGDYCEYDEKDEKFKMKGGNSWQSSGYDYRTVYAYCEAMNYEAKNNAKQDAYYESVKSTAEKKYGTKDNQTAAQKKAYNQEVLGLTYKGDEIENPFAKKSEVPAPTAAVDNVLTCDDGVPPDANGCCTGETYTDMGDAGWNCCPDTGGDCFPPIIVQ